MLLLFSYPWGRTRWQSMHQFSTLRDVIITKTWRHSPNETHVWITVKEVMPVFSAYHQKGGSKPPVPPFRSPLAVDEMIHTAAQHEWALCCFFFLPVDSCDPLPEIVRERHHIRHFLRFFFPWCPSFHNRGLFLPFLNKSCFVN